VTPPLFTPRFAVMFGFSFLVFASLFQLLPVAPYRMLALGGTTASAGWFLGLLTFSSAVCAPFTGPLCDRIGHRRTLVWAGALLTAITASYAAIADNRVLLTLVVVQGAVWSALMSASGAYATATIPPQRRAEGLGYWGLASIVAIGVAPTLGFWVYGAGWTVLCLELAALNACMTLVAWHLPDEREVHALPLEPTVIVPDPVSVDTPSRFGVEWRVMALAASLALVSYGYGSLTSFSALFADAAGVRPRTIFLSAMACTVVAGRLLVGRRVDTWGPSRVLLVSLVIPAAGLALLAMAADRWGFIVAGLAFGTGFGLMWPAFAAVVMRSSGPARSAAGRRRRRERARRAAARPGASPPPSPRRWRRAARRR